MIQNNTNVLIFAVHTDDQKHDKQRDVLLKQKVKGFMNSIFERLIVAILVSMCFNFPSN